MTANRSSVAAVVVTYNRRPQLQRWLECIDRQTVAPDAVVVVDNGSSDGTAEMLRRHYPSVTLLDTKENIGASGGAAAGMQYAYEAGYEWIWIFDDDAFPKPTALQRALAAAKKIGDRRTGMVWLPFGDFGGWQWRGRKVPVSVSQMSNGHRSPFRVDQVDLNMTLVSRRLVEEIGVPRRDFFIMLWSCEYCLRAADADFAIWVVPEILVRHEHAGSTDCGVWRSYYQTRNQLLLALDRRSMRMFAWWLLRQVRFAGGILLHGDQKWQRAALRLRGAWHAFRGVTGKTVDPVEYTG